MEWEWVHRADDENGAGIFDHAVRVSRRERDIGDHGVEGIGGIDFAKKPTGQLFVSPSSPERDPFERGGLDSCNLNAGDAARGQARPLEPKPRGSCIARFA